MSVLINDETETTPAEIEQIFGKGILESKITPDALLTEEQTIMVQTCFDRLADCFDDILSEPNTSKATIAAIGFSRIDIQNAMAYLFGRPY